ncbi:MAG: hypothetical protein CL946_01460 [Ectothiorhodospiraceae bacterium]|nr:hypothetical protein [Ectothiorhodospiraceae bacterium]
MPIYQSEKDFLRAFNRYNSISSDKYSWHTSVSENDQDCAFGYTIPAGELYFKKYLDTDGEQAIRVSRDCMERMVYLTVDSDIDARETSEQLYIMRHPKKTKLEQKSLR